MDLAWRKSSRSTTAGDNANCVEIAFARENPWRKSSRSTGVGDNGNCVEIAFAGAVLVVRDSKNPGGGVLAFPVGALSPWTRPR